MGIKDGLIKKKNKKKGRGLMPLIDAARLLHQNYEN
jgi:hypothetical protein